MFCYFGPAFLSDIALHLWCLYMVFLILSFISIPLGCFEFFGLSLIILVNLIDSLVAQVSLFHRLSVLKPSNLALLPTEAAIASN